MITRFATALLSTALLFGLPAVANDDDFAKLLGESSQTDSAAKNGVQVNAKELALKQILGKLTPDQNIFVNFLKEEKFEGALFAWYDAFEGSSFAETSTGQALFAYLLFKNGLEIIGLEKLMTIDSPGQISAFLVNWWREAANEQHPVWTLVDERTDANWQAAFGVRAAPLVKKKWKELIANAVADKTDSAASSLRVLSKVEKAKLGEDLIAITAARMLYQKGFLQPAVKYYRQVKKESEYFFEAQEEMAWAYLRKGEPQNAIAISRTLVHSQLAPFVGPEGVLVHAIGNLKVCDHSEAAKTLTYFKDNYRSRAAKLQELVKSDASAKEIEKFIAIAKAKDVKSADLGELARTLPRFIAREVELKQKIREWAALEKETERAGKIYAASLSGAGSRVGFQGKIERLKNHTEGRLQSARAGSYAHIKRISQDELKEISDVLQKLHIVEAELIQRATLADRVVTATKDRKPDVKVGRMPTTSEDRVSFPFEGELWFDEISNYKVDVKKGCQGKKL